MTNKEDFFVVVPFYNEVKAIHQTLNSLADQSDRAFTLVLVDNASTDDTLHIVNKFAAQNSHITICCINEAQKGTGAACDTGFRYAIQCGAKYVARTDADCLPEKDWIKKIKQTFQNEPVDLITGRVAPREDEEPPLRFRERLIIGLVIHLAEHYTRLVRRGKQFKYPYMILAGNNMAITADLYLRSGGFPRIGLENGDDDKVLSDKIRLITDRVCKKQDIIVYNSLRRVRKFGVLKTLLWYWNRKYRSDEVDIR